MNVLYNLASGLEVACGYSTVPIKRGEKRPAVKEWQKGCQEPVRYDQFVWGNAGGIGVCLGYFDLTGVDLDTDDQAVLDIVSGLLPAGCIRKVGAKGFTAFARAPWLRGKVVVPLKNPLKSGKAAKIEFLSIGQQSVIPPTPHPDTGQPYRYLSKETFENTCVRDLPELPPDFIDQLRDALKDHMPPGKALSGAPMQIAPSVILDLELNIKRAIAHLKSEHIQVGGEDTPGTFDAARRCRDLGISEEKTYELMLEHYLPRCHPPLTIETLRKKVANAFYYAKVPAGVTAKVPEPFAPLDRSILNRTQLPAPPMPLDGFTPAMQAFLRQAAEALVTPIDYVAWHVLTAAAGIVGARRGVSPWPGWVQYAILRSVAIGIPGSSKSNDKAPFDNALMDAQNARELLHRAQMEAWNARQAEKEKRRRETLAQKEQEDATHTLAEKQQGQYNVLTEAISKTEKELQHAQLAEKVATTQAEAKAARKAIAKAEERLANLRLKLKLAAEYYAGIAQSAEHRTDVIAEALMALSALPAESEDEQPPLPTIVIGSITKERAAELLRDNPGGLFCNRDELTAMFGAMGKYNRGAADDRAFFLEAYEGGRYFVDTKLGGRIEVPHMAISIWGTTQPDKLNEDFFTGISDGFADRFAFIWPDALPKRRPSVDADFSFLSGVLVQLAQIVLATGEDGKPEKPQVHRLTPDATAIFEEWWGEGGKNENDRLKAEGLYQGVIAKMGGTVLRLALVFHLLANPGCDPASQISAETVRLTIALAENYIKPMAARALAEASIPRAEQNARKLATWLLEPKPDGTRLEAINARIVRRQSYLGTKDHRDVDAAIEILVGAGWLRPHPTRDSHRHGRMTKDFEVNPDIFS